MQHLICINTGQRLHHDLDCKKKKKKKKKKTVLKYSLKSTICAFKQYTIHGNWKEGCQNIMFRIGNN